VTVNLKVFTMRIWENPKFARVKIVCRTAALVLCHKCSPRCALELRHQVLEFGREWTCWWCFLFCGIDSSYHVLAGLCLPSCAHLLASGQPAVCLADGSCQQAGSCFLFMCLRSHVLTLLAVFRQKVRLKMKNSKMK
jgi:hypothetical protein